MISRALRRLAVLDVFWAILAETVSFNSIADNKKRLTYLLQRLVRQYCKALLGCTNMDWLFHYLKQ